MHMETETDIQIQQEVSQVEAQAKAPAEELTPPMLKVTPTPVQETTSVQVEEEVSYHDIARVYYNMMCMYQRLKRVIPWLLLLMLSLLHSKGPV